MCKDLDTWCECREQLESIVMPAFLLLAGTARKVGGILVEESGYVSRDRRRDKKMATLAVYICSCF